MNQLPTTPYLDRPRPRKRGDKYVGGTLIADEIVTLEQHYAALATPDLIRVKACAACDWPVVHVHDRRTRKLDGLGSATIDILIFRCARPGCRVVWRVLPAFLARHLWRTWERVGAALGSGGGKRSRTPTRTRRRWLGRLREPARTMVVVLGRLGPQRPPSVAELSLGATRRKVIEAFGGFARLAELAALIDRLVPGVRVM